MEPKHLWSFKLNDAVLSFVAEVKDNKVSVCVCVFGCVCVWVCVCVCVWVGGCYLRFMY